MVRTLETLSQHEKQMVDKFDIRAFIFPGFYLLWGRCYLSYLLLTLGAFLGPIGIIVRIYVGYNARKRAYINSSRGLDDFLYRRNKFTTELWELFLVGVIIAAIIRNINK